MASGVGTAEQMFGCPVEQHNFLILIHCDDCVHRGFNDALQPALADQKLLFSCFTADHGTHRLPIRMIAGLLRLHHQTFGMGLLNQCRFQLVLSLAYTESTLSR